MTLYHVNIDEEFFASLFPGNDEGLKNLLTL